MIHLFQREGYRTRLTPKKLNKEIKALNDQSDNDILFDLSALEWSNTSTLVELILRIETLISEGFKVTVALPNRNPLLKEHRLINTDQEYLVKVAVERRNKIRDWLHKLKIIDALLFKHLPDGIRRNITVLDVYDSDYVKSESESMDSKFFKVNTGSDPEFYLQNYEFYVPLMWTDGSLDQLTQIKNRLFASNLEANHVNSITEIIIKELTKNVQIHSNKTHGLFCVGVSKFRPSKIFRTDYYDTEMLFFRKKENGNFNINEGEFIIEIIFGDAGEGIINTLKKNSAKKPNTELIRYAFDKWSTQIPYDDSSNSYLNRGTRGLYHVRRIMQNYDGMASIRTGKYLAGFNDLTNEFIDEQSLCNFIGTILTIRLLPKRLHQINHRYYPTSEPITKQEIPYHHVQLNVNYYSQGLTDIAKASTEDSAINFLVSLQFKNWKGNESKELFNERLRGLLSGLCDLRHPNVHIVYGFPVDYANDDLKRLVIDVNEEITRRLEGNKVDLSGEKIQHDYDPVMIIGPNGNIYWIGIDSSEIENIFTELSHHPAEIDALSAVNNKLINYIKTDTGLFSIIDGFVQLKFNQNAPIDFFKKEIKKEVEIIISKQAQSVTVTPNLSFVKGWFDIKKICGNFENEYALSLYQLWIVNRQQILEKCFPLSFQKNNTAANVADDVLTSSIDPLSPNELDEIQRKDLKANLKILVENEVDKHLGEKFLRLLDISNSYSNLKVLADEVDNKKPRRIPLFEMNDKVIIISSVISTRETAINLVKSVLRSQATPIAFFSLADFSGEYSEIDQNYIKDVWGVSVLAYSIISDNRLIAERKSYNNMIFRSPIDFKEETITPRDKLNFHIESGFRAMILKSKSLHFSHIGKPNGRHFTFYFNAKRFLADRSIYKAEIWAKFKPVIDKWFKKINHHEENVLPDSVNSTTLSIWHPDSEYKKGFQGQGDDLSMILKTGLKDDYGIDLLNNVESTSRENTSDLYFENIPKAAQKIIVDWGTISGESIEKLIYKAHKSGYKNILVCIFLNQLSEKKKLYLQSISKIATDFPVIDSAPKELFVKHIEGKNSFQSDIEIEFIHNFPLTCYESDYECNICALIKELSDFTIPNSILNRYAGARKKALYIRPREATLDEPFDFYEHQIDGTDIDESKYDKILLPQEFILRMFEFKTLLMNAQSSTYWSLRVKQELVSVLKYVVESGLIGNENDLVWIELVNKSKKIVEKFSIFCPEMADNINLPDFNINDKLSRSHCMIYFLSVETMWMQKPPLSISEMRQILALIAKVLIFNANLKITEVENEKDIDVVRIKYAAVTVLRVADKRAFIKNIPPILRYTQFGKEGSDSIIENVLFHTNTFISKEYHASHQELLELEPILNNVEDMFLEHPKFLKLRDGLWYLKLFAKNLITKGIFRNFSSAEIVKSCLEAYKATFQHYGHSELQTKFNKLLFPFALTEEELGLYTQKIDNLNKNWSYVADTLNNLYIFTLRSIPQILASDWAIRNNFFELKRLNLDEAIGYADDFSILLKKIQEDRKLLMNRAFFKSYKAQTELLEDYFIFRPDSNQRERQAKIFSFLSQIRSVYDVALAHVETAANEKLRGEGISTGDDVQITNYIFDAPTLFYPQEELNFLLSHMVENGHKHRRDDNDVRLTLSGHADEKFYVIKLICSGTTGAIDNVHDLRLPKYQRKGLNKIKNALESFQGRLELMKIENGYEFIFKILVL